jgi:hypothetical protein
MVYYTVEEKGAFTKNLGRFKYVMNSSNGIICGEFNAFSARETRRGEHMGKRHGLQQGWLLRKVGISRSFYPTSKISPN